ncbi:hypothetical protein [Alteromonas ponticola]|uniref:Uncharacterized protein n=1 Tax=Alteromonas ponticola TaxID=2720613 RepID=A0ABX1R4S4_9ALTE|nr:hypothetical protein [Alteromonas ponticola]NMH60773.1 hypothetical protein [Alteromonas ponticola]
MKNKWSVMGKPINLAKLRRVNQRRQRREVVSTIIMVMAMMIVAGFKGASAPSR